jgi:hypothetical protein
VQNGDAHWRQPRGIKNLIAMQMALAKACGYAVSAEK